MVIINTQNAQLANRLWGFSSFIANSIEYNYELVNIGFHRYKPYFESTSANDFGVYPIRVSRSGIDKLDHFYSNVFKTWSSFTYRKFKKTPTLFKFYRTLFSEDLVPEIFDLNRPDFVSDAQKKKVLVQGWMFRDLENIKKHREKIIHFFKPSEPFYSEVENEILLTKKKTKADVLVGVHIRRGDYATFLDGKWFYTDEDYALLLYQIKDHYQQLNKTCAFFICSNDKVDESCFENLMLVKNERHFIVDLYCLAKCDLIVGPPSTFSQWAAFYGDKKLIMLLQKSQKLDLAVNNLYTLPAYEDFPERELYRFL